MNHPSPLEAIFFAALEKGSQQERTAYLDEACVSDPELRRRVELMLAAQAQAGSFLEQPAGGLVETVDEQPANEGPATIIGPYKLVQEIGEGGMGSVWMAQQTEPVKRLVALKVIKAGMDTRQVVARFEAERQALAIMDHPNIAKVFDGGATPSGRPYFVMELVKGVPITEYCDRNHLTPRQRLALFIPVCQAVQHAHQKGVIHRDLKPSNVLVAVHDTTPVPKVIDFGVAKTLGQELTDKTLFTGFAQMIGTPLYMSPEQAGQSGLDIDTRSDIYSLGVLLYELLTGTTPFNKERFKLAAYEEIRRIIREEEPPKPSTRLSESKDALPSISAQRHIEPTKLTKLVRGELDWIVMKALEKDRNRRYETANGLSMDVERYLADEPVQACPPSASYRFRKFAHRHRAALATAALVAAVLLVGSVVSTWQAIRASGAEKLVAARMLAETEARHAADVTRKLAQRRLFDAKLDQARARRASGQVGARAECLKALAEAAELAKSLDLEADQQLVLRNEVIACLALHDIRLVQEWGGFPDGSRRVAFDAELKRYAIGDVNGTVRVLSVADHSELARLEGTGERNNLTMIRFSPSGRYLAVRHRPPNGSRIELWDIADRRMVSRVAGANDLDFSPDNRHVAVAEGNGTVQLYEVASDKPTLSLAPKLPRAGNRFVKFNRTGTWLAVWNSEGSEVEVWSIGLGKRLWQLALPPLDDDLGGRVTQKHHVVAWHPHKPIIAIGSHRLIYIWDLVAEKVIDVLKGHQSGVVELAFSPTGDLLVSSSWDGTTRLWDPRGGQNSWTLPGRTAPAIRADGRELAVRNGPRLEILKIEESPEYRSLYFRGESTLTGMLDIDPEGSLLVSAGEQGLRLWDAENGKELDWLRIGVTNSVSFTTDGRHILTAGPAGVFRWPLRRSVQSALLSLGPPEKLLVDPIGTDSYVALSRDRDTLLVSDGRQAAVYSLGSGTLKCRLEVAGNLEGAGNLFRPTVSPDGRWIAAGPWHGSDTRVWDATNGRCVPPFPLDFAGSSRASFSSNGRWLIISNGSDYRLIEVDTWQETRRFPCDLVDVVPGPAAFSPDDRLLAIARTPQVVKLVDPVNGNEIATLAVPRAAVLSWLCFSADGTRLAAGTEGDVIHLWDLRGLRKRLAELSLDWDAPPFTSNGTPRPPVRVESHLGELEPVRQKVALCRRLLAANHRDTRALNNLAWAYVAGPTDLRNPSAALVLAQDAVRLDPRHEYLNTLGVAYYRLGRYREAIDTLNRGIAATKGFAPAEDNFFLAMCHHRLGDREKAQKAYADALFWMEKNPRWEDELVTFRAEAEELLKSDGKGP